MLELALFGIVDRVHNSGIGLVHEEVVELLLLSLNDGFLNNEFTGLSDFKVGNTTANAP